MFGSTGYTQESFEHYKRGVEATLQAMDDIAEPRQVLKPNTKVCKAHSRAIGLYVDLGYCSDTNVARILSWANRYIVSKLQLHSKFLEIALINCVINYCYSRIST